MEDKQVKKFRVVTVGSFERVYTVEATDDTHARQRTRAYIKDSDSLREGVVVEHEDEARYVSGEQVKQVEPAPAGPQAVEAAAS